MEKFPKNPKERKEGVLKRELENRPETEIAKPKTAGESLAGERNLEKIREEIREYSPEKKGPETDAEEGELDRVRRFRRQNPHQIKAASLIESDKALVTEFDVYTRTQLNGNYQPGFGIFPSSDPNENFYGQIWSRDFAHASGNYFAVMDPKALSDSLTTILKYQKPDGALPLRVEKEYLLLKVFPGLRSLAKPIFNLIEKKIRGREERPVYEGQDFSNAEDTVPATIVAAGEFFINSAEGHNFMKQHFGQFQKALDYFRKKVDPVDGLAKTKELNPDWADSLKRGGKLGGINILWARSLRLMSYMAAQLGRAEEAEAYKREFRRVKSSILEKLYDREGGYFRAAEGENRIDAMASIFGALYLLDPVEAAKVEQTMESRLRHKSGLRNFDPPYPQEKIFWPLKVIGNGGYHNEYVWPWVTLENIQVKIKIALQHPDETVRNRYKEEAVADLLDMAELFKSSGGAYEVYRADSRQPVITRFYKPPKNLMANLAAYQGAYLQLEELGWI